MTETIAQDVTKVAEKLSPPRFIAFYLPQFYPIPENDEFWGKGFTEWTNVTRARPRFRGHYQPHVPADLGFYDLRVPEVREEQATLAREYGVYGFCYYHYWFNGRRVLERPLDEVLALGKPDFPFCICWANQNWTRRWEGNDKHVLLEQRYSADDDLAHIRHLIATMEDPRYIRVEGRPLILIYRVELLPAPQRTTEIWRNEVRKAGLGELLLVNVESNYVRTPKDPVEMGFDAALRFQPDFTSFHASAPIRALRKLKSPRRDDKVYSYAGLYRKWKFRPASPYRSFECVTPMWDNSARQERKAYMLKGSTPELYEKWLEDAVTRSRPDSEGQRWVFINAWNEWAEGCHLEPCGKWGLEYLKATKRAFDGR